MEKEGNFFKFDTKLIEGKIIERKSQFIIEVETKDGIMPCHLLTKFILARQKVLLI